MTGRGPGRRGLLTGLAALATGTATATAPATAASATSTAPADPPAPTGTPGRTRWTASWATAQTAPTPADPVASGGVTELTHRTVVRLSAGGRIRLRYGHAFGTAAVLVGPVTAGGHAVTFAGLPTAWLAAGATLTSDPVPGPALPAGADLVIDTHLPGPTGPLSFHRNTHATHWLLDPTGTAAPVRTSSVLLLRGVDVAGTAAPAVAVLGDSLAEGVGTPDDSHAGWTELLARRVTGAAVANLGVSGNRLLLDDARFGPGGQARFDRDVLGLPGLRTLLLALGVNDLQQPPAQTDPARILAGYAQLALRARDAGLHVVGATITPFEGWQRWTPALEAVRNTVNTALRTRPLFDALADFDAALRDPDRPARLLPAYDSGDGLHPNPAGHAALAAAVHRPFLR
ncbi:GDSL-type esterase/lipase family protein [Streptomyces hydrogenans]|uniref:GDSL-type esterase/lipase family protein n=1 Tax=Streptomyces hydrogenans TaxID=1873719 RepID=UPI00381E103F